MHEAWPSQWARIEPSASSWDFESLPLNRISHIKHTNIFTQKPVNP